MSLAAVAPLRRKCCERSARRSVRRARADTGDPDAVTHGGGNIRTGSRLHEPGWCAAVAQLGGGEGIDPRPFGAKCTESGRFEGRNPRVTVESHGGRKAPPSSVATLRLEAPMSDVYQMFKPLRDRAARFALASVAELYEYRPPYPAAVYAQLLALLEGHPQVVLDAGSGPGKIARPLASQVDRVDAVDPSAEMIRVGRGLTGGGHQHLRWIQSSIEDAPLEPPYGIAVAGASFHWFDAERVLARFADVLDQNALLVLISGDAPWQAPWAEAEHEVYLHFASQMHGRRESWSLRDIEQTRLLDHPKFERVGEHVTPPVLFEQDVENYIACQHSRATWAHEAMGDERADEFDAALRAILEPHAKSDRLTFQYRSRMEWGFPRH